VGWQVEVALSDPHQVRLGEHVRYRLPVEDLQRHAVRLARLILQAMPGGHRDFVHREEGDCSDGAALSADRVHVSADLCL
jgi:hypothetical protein